jgi:hypothetical protein
VSGFGSYTEAFEFCPISSRMPLKNTKYGGAMPLAGCLA